MVRKINLILVFVMLISGVFANAYYEDDLIVDNYDYKVEKGFNYYFNKPLSVYVDGSVISAPDKEKQLRLNSKTTSLFFPNYNKKVMIRYLFYKNKACDNYKYQGPIQKDVADDFYCTGSSNVKLELLGYDKHWVDDNGKSKGHDSFEISKWINKGAGLVKIEVHYVRENVKESTTKTKKDIEKDEEIKKAGEHLTGGKIININENNNKPETVYLEEYFCNGNVVEQSILENGKKTKRDFKECSKCNVIEDGSVECVTKTGNSTIIQNSTKKIDKDGNIEPVKPKENDVVSPFVIGILVIACCVGIGSLLYRRYGK